MAATSAPSSSLDVPVDVMVQICEMLLARQTLNPSARPEATSRPDTWEAGLEHFPALGNLARSNPRIEGIVGPFLYQRVRVSMNRPVAMVDLVRHLAEFPQYGAAVEDVTIHDGGEDSANPLTPAQLEYIYEQATKADLRFLPTTDAQRRVEAPWVLIDLLLLRVPNVRKLVLSVPRLPSTKVRADFAARLPDSVVFSHLECLAAHPSDAGYPGMCKRSLVALLRHTPALTHLQVGYCDRRGCDGLIQKALPNLRDLHLSEGPTVDCAELAKFCPSLERLRLGEDGHSVLILATDSMFKTLDYVRTLDPKEIPTRLPQWISKLDFSLDRLLRNLQPIAPTLRELDIDWDVMVATDTESFDLLADFRALRSLRLVFGRWPVGDNRRLVDRLPPVLRSLCLGGQGIRVGEIARLLRARMRSGELPALRSLEYTPVCQEMEPGLPLVLTRLFQGTGVNCSERPNPPSGWTPYRYVCNDVTGRPGR